MNIHQFFFLTALALILVHEMDAVRCREWRIFPLVARLENRAGMLWFILLHIPLFWLLAYFSFRAMTVGSDRFSAGFSVFCILHAFVHLIYERHPKCEFRNTLSRSIIWGCAASGLAALVFYPGFSFRW